MRVDLEACLIQIEAGQRRCGWAAFQPEQHDGLGLRLGLFPLAAHGGPLWEPLCYAQIGGLTAATFITLLLVPVFYSICVLDLKIVQWEENGD